MKYLNSLLILFFICFLFQSCDKGDDETLPPPSEAPQQPSLARRTVLLYCIAQNDMGLRDNSGRSAWENDSLECVVAATHIPDTDRCLIYVDDKHLPRIYEISAKDGIKLVHRWDADYYSTHPDQMYDVLSYVRQNYQSEEYGFIAWSHSDGWIPSSGSTLGARSFGIDVGPDGHMNSNKDKDGNLGSQMNIADISKAMERANIKFKFILFDTCLMQCIETLYELRHVAEYIIGAPVQIPYDGGYYTHLIQNGFFEADVATIAKTYFQDVTTMTSVYSDFGISISVVKTSALDSLAAITSRVLAPIDWTVRRPDMTSVTHYYKYASMYYYRPHYYDFKDAMRHMVSEADFLRFEQILEEAIVYYNATPQIWVGPGYYDYVNIEVDRCCGISMFVPQDVYDKNASICNIGNHNENFKSTAWAKAIGKQ
ncbi:MAG: hypothetical protein J6R91_01580 [Bacteroidaceae bacterium]|nr:hypothetical protein [Bacteroidaceae bacterium]